MNVSLREVQESDLAALYEHQRDPEATRMAEFPSRDWDAFSAHWTKIITDGAGTMRTVLFGEDIAGNIVCWQDSGASNIGYWIGREYWGRGIASAAVAEFLKHVPDRPLVARVAKHNAASLRVLEKCGFSIAAEEEFTRTDGSRGMEYVLTLRT